jgi:hypothetical protein
LDNGEKRKDTLRKDTLGAGVGAQGQEAKKKEQVCIISFLSPPMFIFILFFL